MARPPGCSGARTSRWGLEPAGFFAAAYMAAFEKALAQHWHSDEQSLPCCSRAEACRVSLPSGYFADQEYTRRVLRVVEWHIIHHGKLKLSQIENVWNLYTKVRRPWAWALAARQWQSLRPSLVLLPGVFLPRAICHLATWLSADRITTPLVCQSWADKQPGTPDEPRLTGLRDSLQSLLFGMVRAFCGAFAALFRLTASVKLGATIDVTNDTTTRGVFCARPPAAGGLLFDGELAQFGALCGT